MVEKGTISLGSLRERIERREAYKRTVLAKGVEIFEATFVPELLDDLQGRLHLLKPAHSDATTTNVDRRSLSRETHEMGRFWLNSDGTVEMRLGWNFRKNNYTAVGSSNGTDYFGVTVIAQPLTGAIIVEGERLFSKEELGTPDGKVALEDAILRAYGNPQTYSHFGR